MLTIAVSSQKFPLPLRLGDNGKAGETPPFRLTNGYSFYTVIREQGKGFKMKTLIRLVKVWLFIKLISFTIPAIIAIDFLLEFVLALMK